MNTPKRSHGHRVSIRLKGYDYSACGAYFVTICVKEKTSLFGEIIDWEACLNDAGIMVDRWWNKLSDKFSNVETDEYIVMPDHVHGIIVIGDHSGSPVSEIVQWFKTMTTNEYIRCVDEFAWPRFPGKLWHRNYFEHIIRNEDELNIIREYIRLNPEKREWERDFHQLLLDLGETPADLAEGAKP